MRKFLLSLCALAALTASAQDKKLVRTDYYSVNVDENGAETQTFSYSSNTKYYDNNNVCAMENSSSIRYFFTYDANGNVATREEWNWGSATGWTNTNRTSTYVYNEAGKVLKSGQIEAGSYSENEYDENGGMIKMTNYYNGEPSYVANYKLIYNAEKQLIQSDQLSSDGSVIQSRTLYTYNADGSLAKTENGYFEAEDKPLTNPTIVTYFYNTDGSIQKTRTESDGRWGHLISDEVYIYATYSASYVPQNVKATGNADCTATVTWDAVEGATSYIVIYDQNTDTVATTTLTTGMLLDGEHQFFVQAIISGEAKNISSAAVASVKDAGKLPADGFKIVGVEVGEDQWGSPAYNTTVQFTLPEGHSEIKAFNVYYDLESSWSKVSVEPSTATIEGNTVTLVVPFSQYNVGTYNSETYEYDLGVKPLFVVINYASGDSDKSNVEYWDFAANETSIASAQTASTPVSIYSVSGAKIANAQKGINIVKMSNGEVKKVLVK